MMSAPTLVTSLRSTHPDKERDGKVTNTAVLDAAIAPDPTTTTTTTATTIHCSDVKKQSNCSSLLLPSSTSLSMTFNINICAPDQVIVGEEFSIYIEVITPYSRLSSSRQRQVSLLVDHKSCGMTWLVAGKTISSQLDFKYSSESYDGSNDDHGEGKRPIEYAEAKVKFRVIPLKEGHLLLPKFSLVMDSGDDMKKKVIFGTRREGQQLR
mmetsp:Transcript_5969/g.8196  ORF Transcript_5969/g.8196 Transcript_5969/m.8196 type:complete len:210 (-) Transcript_5969:93-722(-)